MASGDRLRKLARATTSSRFDDVLAEMEGADCRRTTVNLIPMRQQATVEVRLHGGTTEASKVLLWISLWMQLLHTFESLADAEIEPAELKARAVVQPSGCIVSWLYEHVPGVSAEFLGRIQERREAIRALWQANRSLRAWVRSADEWETVEGLSTPAE